MANMVYMVNMVKIIHIIKIFVEPLSVLRVLAQPELDREGVDFVFAKPRQPIEKTTATIGENHGNSWRKPRQPLQKTAPT